MKGIVFAEFLEMVDERFGLEMTEELIAKSPTLSTGGSYTNVGTYPHGELVGMVMILSEKTKIPVKDLLEAFGEYLFKVLSTAYSSLMKDINGLFNFLAKIEDYIHVEVKKLYPEAELPRFETSQGDHENELIMIYMSKRSMVDFGVGLIKGAAVYFNEEVEIATKDLTPEQTGEKVEIKITKI